MADAAALRAGKITVSLHQHFALRFQLICQKDSEHPKAVIIWIL